MVEIEERNLFSRNPGILFFFLAPCLGRSQIRFKDGGNTITRVACSTHPVIICIRNNDTNRRYDKIIV